MQPTGRTVPSSARALIADGDQRNVELCGRGRDRLQLICKSLGGHTEIDSFFNRGVMRGQVSWTTRFRRFAYRLGPRRQVLGIEVRFLLPDRRELETAASKVHEAVALIAAHDPQRFARLTRDLRRIWVGATQHRAEWVAELEMCVLRFDYVVSPDTSAARLALTLAHEATHARLDRVGCGYEEENRARIERICVAAEVALAERLPNEGALAESARARLEFGPEVFTDAAFKARGERALQELGWIGRLGGVIGRAMLWLDRRRAA